MLGIVIVLSILIIQSWPQKLIAPRDLEVAAANALGQGFLGLEDPPGQSLALAAFLLLPVLLVMILADVFVPSLQLLRRRRLLLVLLCRFLHLHVCAGVE